MSLESDIFDTLKGLVSNKCYPDVAPSGTAAPYIKWQQAGGTAINFMASSPPGLRNARIQVACWAASRLEASELARDAEDAMVNSSMKAFVLGAFVAVHDEETKLFGTLQDFSVHY